MSVSAVNDWEEGGDVDTEKTLSINIDFYDFRKVELRI